MCLLADFSDEDSAACRTVVSERSSEGELGLKTAIVSHVVPAT